MPAHGRSEPGRLTKAVAAQLRARLAVLDWTQTKLATFPGVPSQSHLSQQLKGRRHIDLDELAAICDALGLEVVEVLRDAWHERADQVLDPVGRQVVESTLERLESERSDDVDDLRSSRFDEVVGPEPTEQERRRGHG